MNGCAPLEERFNAAVNVIQSLPKNGPFQPSHEMQLRFYALFKRARFGVCSGSRPGMWDVVGRAKWDAWKKADSVTREQAMEMYVDDLKKVVETMPHTDSVAAFLDALGGNFYETVPPGDVEEGDDEDEEHLTNGKSSPGVSSYNTAHVTSDEEDIFYDSHHEVHESQAEQRVTRVSADQVLSRLDHMESRLSGLTAHLSQLEQRVQTLTSNTQNLPQSHRMSSSKSILSRERIVLMGLVVWPLLLQFVVYLWSRPSRRRGPA